MTTPKQGNPIYINGPELHLESRNTILYSFSFELRNTKFQ